MKKGFTLIELLVCIAIIGLLSTLAVVALNDAKHKEEESDPSFRWTRSYCIEEYACGDIDNAPDQCQKYLK
jgi:prepilin-type N-terminal cleavage/methylation domain-containing protein